MNKFAQKKPQNSLSLIYLFLFFIVLWSEDI